MSWLQCMLYMIQLSGYAWFLAAVTELILWLLKRKDVRGNRVAYERRTEALKRSLEHEMKKRDELAEYMDRIIVRLNYIIEAGREAESEEVGERRRQGTNILS